MNYVLKNKNPGVRKWPLWFGILLVTGFIGSYVFYAVGMGINAVQNHNLRDKIDKITPKISELETEYVNLQNEITLEKAHGFGFKSANSEFITGTTIGKSVSIRNEIQ